MCYERCISDSESLRSKASLHLKTLDNVGHSLRELRNSVGERTLRASLPVPLEQALRRIRNELPNLRLRRKMAHHSGGLEKQDEAPAVMGKENVLRDEPRLDHVAVLASLEQFVLLVVRDQLM